MKSEDDVVNGVCVGVMISKLRVLQEQSDHSYASAIGDAIGVMEKIKHVTDYLTSTV